MKNLIIHLVLLILAIIIFLYTMCSDDTGMVTIASGISFLFSCGMGFFILDFGFRINSQFAGEKIDNYYFIFSFVFYWLSFLLMAIGTILLWLHPKQLISPLFFAGYGLFISSGIMKDKYKKRTKSVHLTGDSPCGSSTSKRLSELKRK